MIKKGIVMNFKNKLRLLILPVFILSACNLQFVETTQKDPNAANLELTAIVQQMLIDQAAQQGSVNVAASTPIARAGTLEPPTEEVVIPAEVLPPATGDVTVTVSVATNCRVGPGTAFASVYGMPVGQVAKVVAKNSYSGYWIIEIPGQAGQTCWLWGQYATLTGDVAGLKDVVTPTSVATQTPTATITPTPTVTQPAAIAGCTDKGADNYNSAATVDDGSCIYDVIITNTTVACEDQLDGTSKFTYTIDWIKNNNLSGLEYYILYQWEEADETPKTNREEVLISTSPIIGTDIKPTQWILSVSFRVVNPVTTVRTTTNPIKLKCP